MHIYLAVGGYWCHFFLERSTAIYILHRRRKFINRILSWAYPLSDILSFAHNILPNA